MYEIISHAPPVPPPIPSSPVRRTRYEAIHPEDIPAWVTTAIDLARITSNPGGGEAWEDVIERGKKDWIYATNTDVYGWIDPETLSACPGGAVLIQVRRTDNERHGYRVRKSYLLIIVDKNGKPEVTCRKISRALKPQHPTGADLVETAMVRTVVKPWSFITLASTVIEEA